MSRWYRRYAGTVSDPKIAEAAMIAECSRAVVIATWDMILESAAEVNDGGAFKATSRNVAATICETAATTERVFAALETLGMIASGVIVAWSKRQFQSDSSTERSRKHRALKREKRHATEMQRCATPPDTESDTDTDTEEDKITSSASRTARDGCAAPKIDLDRMMAACNGALDNPVNCMGLLTSATPMMWLEAGCDMDRDILPTLEAAGRKYHGKRIRSWDYFTGAITEARDRRQRGLPAVAAAQPKKEPTPIYKLPTRKPDPTEDELMAYAIAELQRTGVAV